MAGKTLVFCSETFNPLCFFERSGECGFQFRQFFDTQGKDDLIPDNRYLMKAKSVDPNLKGLHSIKETTLGSQ